MIVSGIILTSIDKQNNHMDTMAIINNTKRTAYLPGVYLIKVMSHKGKLWNVLQ